MTPPLGQGDSIGLEDGAELALSLAPVLREVASATRDHDDANNTGTEPGNDVYRIKQQQEQIANVLSKYWQRRYPGVEEVHHISREQGNKLGRGIKVLASPSSGKGIKVSTSVCMDASLLLDMQEWDSEAETIRCE